MSKSTRAEKEQRVSEIFKMCLAGVKTADIVRYGVEKWGITRSGVEKYLKVVYKRFKEHAKIDQDIEFGRVKDRYEDLYIKAYKGENLTECRLLNKEISNLHGLETFNINLGGEININFNNKSKEDYEKEQSEKE